MKNPFEHRAPPQNPLTMEDYKVSKSSRKKKGKKVGKDKKKKGGLTAKSLHGALKGLLKDAKKEQESGEHIIEVATPEKRTKTKKSKPINPPVPRTRRYRPKSSIVTGIPQKNGVIYIKSRENKLIPKLTDDEVMARHKKADETMMDVWMDIIHRYENVADQGDVLDLQTGQIVEDNGHIFGKNRSLPAITETSTVYTPSMADILLDDDGDIYTRSELKDISIWAGMSTEKDDDEGVALEEDV